MGYSVGKNTLPVGVLVAYAVLLTSGLAMYHVIADGQFSSIMTMSAMLQTFAFVLLATQIAICGHAGGISAGALAMDAVALLLRLSSTTHLNGYLPVDSSGDWFYQAVEVVSVVVVFWLLYQVLQVHHLSYQAEQDSFPCVPVTVVAIVLAALLHGDMNDRPLFDSLWMAGLFISTVAVLPQLWLSSHAGGRVEALTSHYIAAMAFSRALSGLFMWHARNDITCEPWVEGVNHSIWAILGAHLVHMFLLGDFTYYYARSLARGGDGRIDFAAGELCTCV